jgi:hypothetical protein
VCITSLWIQRNRREFKNEKITKEGSVQDFWETALRQVAAITKRERRRPDTIVNGTRRFICLQALEEQPTEKAPQGTSLAQPPDRTAESALLARLTINQTSRRH